MARVLERMKEWEKALDIWRRLGRSATWLAFKRRCRNLFPEKASWICFKLMTCIH